jgi:thiol-disulfide isomerase/thioredoxin
MRSLTSVVFTLLLATSSFAGENLKLNPKLDYSSDSQDGPLITGDSMDSAVASGKPAYIILYGEGCYNSKRQARRTVSLYEKYKGRVQFVVIDLDHALPPAQQQLQKKYYRGYIPHVVVLDPSGTALYNSSGEVDEAVITDLLERALLDKGLPDKAPR